jgi:hypothetical protein
MLLRCELEGSVMRRGYFQPSSIALFYKLRSISAEDEHHQGYYHNAPIIEEM